MSQVRSISGIDQDLWDEAKEEYDSVSKRIKELLDQDLRTNEDENPKSFKLLKKSDLTNQQIELARDLIKNGAMDKTAAQLGNKLKKHFTDKDYREDARKSVLNSEIVPVEAKGKGTQRGEVSCPDCKVDINLAVLRNNEFSCPKCDMQLYDLNN